MKNLFSQRFRKRPFIYRNKNLKILTKARIIVQTENGKSRKTALQTKGTETLKAKISSVLGADISMRLTELSDENLEFTQEDIESFFHLPENSPDKKIDEIRTKTNQFKFSGFISKNEEALSVGRASPDRQFFFINKRPVDVPFLSKILNSEWRRYSSKKYPVIVKVKNIFL